MILLARIRARGPAPAVRRIAAGRDDAPPEPLAQDALRPRLERRLEP